MLLHGESCIRQNRLTWRQGRLLMSSSVTKSHLKLWKDELLLQIELLTARKQINGIWTEQRRRKFYFRLLSSSLRSLNLSCISLQQSQKPAMLTIDSRQQK